MKISIGAEWQAPGGGNRWYGVVYEEEDLKAVQAQKNLTRGQAIGQLSRQGEMLVVSYVHSQGGMGAGTYAARMQELRDGT